MKYPLWQKFLKKKMLRKLKKTDNLSLVVGILQHFHQANIVEFTKKARSNHLKPSLFYHSFRHLLEARKLLIERSRKSHNKHLKYSIELLFGKSNPVIKNALHVNYSINFKEFLAHAGDDGKIKEYLIREKTDLRRCYLKLYLDDVALAIARDKEIDSALCEEFQESLERSRAHLLKLQKKHLGIRSGFFSKFALNHRANVVTKRLRGLSKFFDTVGTGINDAAIVLLGKVASLFKTNIYQLHMASVNSGKKLANAAYVWQFAMVLIIMCGSMVPSDLFAGGEDFVMQFDSGTSQDANALSLAFDADPLEVFSNRVLSDFLTPDNLQEFSELVTEEFKEASFEDIISGGGFNDKESRFLVDLAQKVAENNKGFIENMQLYGDITAEVRIGDHTQTLSFPLNNLELIMKEIQTQTKLTHGDGTVEFVGPQSNDVATNYPKPFSMEGEVEQFTSSMKGMGLTGQRVKAFFSNHDNHHGVLFELEHKSSTFGELVHKLIVDKSNIKLGISTPSGAEPIKVLGIKARIFKVWYFR